MPETANATTAISGLHGVHVVLTAILLGLAGFLILAYKRSRLDLDSIPSATLKDVLLLCLDSRRAHEWFRQCHEKYGPIFRARVFYREIVLVADTQVAQQVLSSGPLYLPQKSFEYSAIDPAHGLKGHSGMLSHRNERVWKIHRGCLAPAYTLSALKPLHPSIMCAVVDLGNRINIKAQAGPTVICLNHEMLMTTVQIELETFMRLPMAEIGVDAHNVVCDMEFLTSVCGRFIQEPWARLFYCTRQLAQLTEAGRQFHETRRRFGALTESIVEELERRGPFKETDFSLAACLLRMEDPDKPGQRASRAAIAAEVANSLLATETVPSTVSWTVYLLARHPEAEARVLLELTAAGVPVGGAPADIAAELLKPETIKQLTYFQAVVNESLRLHPAGAPASNRVATRPVQIGPYKVPAGVLVWPCVYSIQTYSGNWERPMEFDPERWLGSPATGIHPETGASRFIPFSIGPKACIGQNFALLEVRWSVLMLIACFRFKVAQCMGTHEDVIRKTEMGFVYQPPGGIWFEAEQRSGAKAAAAAGAPGPRSDSPSENPPKTPGRQESSVRV